MPECASDIHLGQVHPFFCENGEEMKWNPVFELWTWLGLDLLYGALLRMLPRSLEWIFWQVIPASSCTASMRLLVAVL